MNCVPDSEFRARLRKFQANIREAGLDAALVHGNEADFANVRYLCEYWPTFEAGGVFVPGIFDARSIVAASFCPRQYARFSSVIGSQR